MKIKLFAIALMAVGIWIAAKIMLVVLVLKGPVVLVGVAMYVAGKIIYKLAPGESNGVLSDAIAGIKAMWRSGERVVDTAKEEFKKS